MATYPLLFTFVDKVEGNGFLATSKYTVVFSPPRKRTAGGCMGSTPEDWPHAATLTLPHMLSSGKL